ncbi:hypothetical protein VPH35_053221 [Triticum aestivum]|uniref:Uncharacterized protein n=1 Tax=Triticum aestivum TaxID=4565 RepID=A0A077S3Z6_WHEAT|nr:unnamed protein product [Triticum aestivum]CDM84338.1 unnamed protein product [Triticum aestivum]
MAVGYIAVDYFDVSCSQDSVLRPNLGGRSGDGAAAPMPRCQARRALAYLALAVTFLFHCIYAGAVWIFLAADPGYIFGKIFFTVVICLILVCNLTCLSDLL